MGTQSDIYSPLAPRTEEQKDGKQKNLHAHPTGVQQDGSSCRQQIRGAAGTAQKCRDQQSQKKKEKEAFPKHLAEEALLHHGPTLQVRKLRQGLEKPFASGHLVEESFSRCLISAGPSAELASGF